MPGEVVGDSGPAVRGAAAVRRLARLGSAGRLFRPNYTGTEILPDGSARWRQRLARAAAGPELRARQADPAVARAAGAGAGPARLLNVAPATRTRSVLRNRVLAAAYAGAHRFGVEVFDPSTSNTLMAALLVHDLREPKAAAAPATTLRHPLELFWQGANHGGLWRNAFEPRSVLGLAVALGMVQRGA